VAISVKVRNDRQFIVPVRFARAVTGLSVRDAPDVDDRGFAMGTRPATWGTSDARGAMVGITESDTVRIKILREDIEDTAVLFVTSTDPAVARVIAPAGGGPVPADGIVQIQGVTDFRNRPVKIQVRLGTRTGPVLGELEPHVFQLRRLRVFAHFVTINGIGPTRTLASLTAFFRAVNDVWRAAGIELTFAERDVQIEVVNGLAVAGQMTTNLSGAPPTFNEFSTIINLRPDANAINVYFVRAANEVLGLTFEKTVARPTGFGIVMTDAAQAHTLAHELGHYLDNDTHSETDGAGNTVRRDIWVLRFLMFTFATYGHLNLAPAYKNDVGYGVGQVGELIPVKDFAADPLDGDLVRSRRRALDPN
jgi:hypothetical protein